MPEKFVSRSLSYIKIFCEKNSICKKEWNYLKFLSIYTYNKIHDRNYKKKNGQEDYVRKMQDFAEIKDCYKYMSRYSNDVIVNSWQ